MKAPAPPCAPKPAGRGWGHTEEEEEDDEEEKDEEDEDDDEEGGAASPSSRTFFPEGSFERERVDTSLRMQDLVRGTETAITGGGTLTPGPRRPLTEKGNEGAGEAGILGRF